MQELKEKDSEPVQGASDTVKCSNALDAFLVF